MECEVRLLMRSDLDGIKKFSSFMAKRYLRDRTGFCIVAEINDVILGFVACDIDGDIAEMTHIEVAPPVQRNKVATRLIEQVRQMTDDDMSIEAIVRDDNLAAQKLLDSLGFRVTNRRKKDGQDAYLFRLGKRFHSEAPDITFRGGKL